MPSSAIHPLPSPPPSFSSSAILPHLRSTPYLLFFYHVHSLSSSTSLNPPSPSTRPPFTETTPTTFFNLLHFFCSSTNNLSVDISSVIHPQSPPLIATLLQFLHNYRLFLFLLHLFSFIISIAYLTSSTLLIPPPIPFPPSLPLLIHSPSFLPPLPPPHSFPPQLSPPSAC